MRWSRQLLPTLREVPLEAEIPSHQLALRAGLIRRLGAGLYIFLPAGLRALRKVERIIREEMDRAGAIEVLMPALQPAEIWERTGRLESLKDVMFHVGDRQDRGLVLGPTHEEVITELVAREINSWRQLPRTFYQIQTKFRDEIRPRFGLMRAKEFIMKDAYSFDADAEGADASYQAMYAAYERIFRRCGVRAKAVEADTGAMGGKSSHEFMVLADSGEDGIVECDHCAYAANRERAEARAGEAPAWPDDAAPLEMVPTPGARTIEEVSKFLGVPAGRLVKTLVYLADGNPVAALVPGDRELNEIKLRNALGARALQLADDATIERVTGAPVGFAGPCGLKIPVWADGRLKGCRGAVTGANRADTHAIHFNLDRDAGTVVAFSDLAFAREGDGCPRCAAGVLREKRGIEVGHVFRLGTKYSEALHAEYLDEAGQRKTIIMGCYGIGVTRTLQAVIEQHFDANGIRWPVSVAPYTVEVVAINMQSPACVAAAEAAVAALEAAGIDVLYDDRDARPGVKFNDADLLGLPYRVSVGERSLARGVLEIKRRADGQMTEVPPADLAARLSRMIRDDEARLANGA